MSGHNRPWVDTNMENRQMVFVKANLVSVIWSPHQNVSNISKSHTWNVVPCSTNRAFKMSLATKRRQCGTADNVKPGAWRCSWASRWFKRSFKACASTRKVCSGVCLPVVACSATISCRATCASSIVCISCSEAEGACICDRRALLTMADLPAAD